MEWEYLHMDIKYTAQAAMKNAYMNNKGKENIFHYT